MCVCSAIFLEGVLVLKQGWVRQQGTPYSFLSRSRSMKVRAEKVKGCEYTWSAVHKCHSPMSVLVQQLNPSGHFWVPTQVGLSVSPSKTAQEAQSTVYNLHNRGHSRALHLQHFLRSQRRLDKDVTYSRLTFCNYTLQGVLFLNNGSCTSWNWGL
jgi:ABC-type sulfate/molybdate transport systems ATPase subunit